METFFNFMVGKPIAGNQGFPARPFLAGKPRFPLRPLPFIIRNILKGPFEDTNLKRKGSQGKPWFSCKEGACGETLVSLLSTQKVFYLYYLQGVHHLPYNHRGVLLYNHHLILVYNYYRVW